MFHLPYQITRRNIFFALVVTFILAGCAGEEIKDHDFKLVYPPPPDDPRFVYERTITSSFDVKDISSSDRLRQFATGTMGTAEGMSKPYGVAVYKGRVFVTDTVKRSVLMFDVPGKQFKAIGTEGPGQLRKPIGIDVSQDGEIYVADNTAKRVVVFDQEGNFLRTFGDRQNLNRPSGVAVSPDGSKAYVIDTGGVDTQDHHLLIFDSHTGELLKTIGTRGKEEGDFNLALQVSTAPDGTVYVTDSGNFRVQAFNADGSFKMAFGKVGRKIGNFARPTGIANDSDGNIYVVDSAFGNFQIFNSKAELLMHIGDRAEQPIPGHYLLPKGIDVDEDGRIYMVDQFFHKVDIFRPIDMGPEDGYLGGAHLKKESKG